MEVAVIVLSLFAGLGCVFALQVMAARRRSSAEEKVMKGYFLLGLSGMMAKLAMADGKVSDDEIALAERFFNTMELTASERALCIGNFVTARRDALDARDYAKRFLAYANPVACEFLYGLLWRLSLADRSLDPAEDRLLQSVAGYLGLPEDAYARFKAGKRPSCDPDVLRTAGVPESLVALA